MSHVVTGSAYKIERSAIELKLIPIYIFVRFMLIVELRGWTFLQNEMNMNPSTLPALIGIDE